MRRILLTLAIICLCSQMSAQFSGSGSGTSTDPYRIFNADQLSQLRNFLNQEGVYFKLQNDIDLTDWLADNYPSQGWQPVGSTAEPFKGILDGNNKTISGFSITRSTSDNVGLFAAVSGATIKNLTLKGNISGKAYVGSLFGSGTATVTNYTFEGTVTGSGNYTGGVGGSQTAVSSNLTVTATVNGASYTGGIFGKGAGITTATFTGQVTGSSSYVGGLEGSGSGTFSSCTVNAPVKSTNSTASFVGGLIGSVSSTITANNCNQEGVIQGKLYTGGLFGKAPTTATISGCIHRGNISGTQYTAGIIGSGSTMSLSSCYAECNIIGSANVGGIVGQINNISNSSISGCHFWGDITGTSCLGGIVGSRDNTSASTIDFTATITASDRGEYESGGYGVHDVYDTRCFFSKAPSFKIYPSSSYGTGTNRYYYLNGTSAIIKTATLGDWVKSNRSVTYWDEGQERTFTISAPCVVYCNLIDGNTATAAVNLNIFNCSVIGNINSTGAYAGGIIGKDRGDDNKNYTLSESITINYYESGAKSLSTATLNKYSYTYVTTNISESYYSGTLTGSDNIGGIVGSKQGGCINNCYVSASITGGKNLGGIAGSLYKESLNTNENSMNSNISICTSITGTSNVGRIYGSTDGNFTTAALGTNSENRAIASTQVVVNGVTQTITDNLQHGTAVGLSQLRLRANYVAWGWDFNNCWTIQETESFPYKTWQSAPPTFNGRLTSGATTISGKSINGGTVHISTSAGKTYATACSGSTWTVNIQALHAGEKVTAYAAGNEKEKSYFTTATVGFLGSGTEDDPYQIASAEDLQGINTGGYYKIMNDISLTSWINTNSSTKGWIPVGYDGDAVYIDGDNHKISGLWTNSTDTYTGLFSKLKDGYIKNLNVEVASGKKVRGRQYTGILISYATSFKILNCSVRGNAEGTTFVGGFAGYITGSSSDTNLSDLTYEGTLSSTTSSSKIGGIAGYGSSCRLYHAASTAQVTSTGNNALIGGLIGNMYGLTASHCTANVNINASGTGNKVGGLFGTVGCSTSTATTITESYSSGTIQVTGSDSWAGGIAGHLITNAQLSDSYSTATITGTQYTAGLVGQASGASKINRCYATGNLTGTYFGAGIVGKLNDANTKTTNCVALNNILSYTDQSAWACRVIGSYDEASGDPDGSNLALATMQVSLNNIPVKKYDDLVEGIAKSEDELKQVATYAEKGWDFENVWSMAENGYPLLKWQIPAPTLATAITLNKTTLNLTEAGQTATLIATITPENADNRTVAWTSSNTAVVTVDNNGLVTAIANGTATITATTSDGTNLSASCNVTVSTPVKATAIALSQTNLSFTAANETATLTATITPSNVTDGSVTWTSSNTNVATVSSEGVVTAIANGTATITATTNDGTNLSSTCIVSVNIAVPTEPDTDISALDNVIYIYKVEAGAGQEFDLSIKMKNTAAIRGYQFDLYLPDGMSVVEDEDGYPLVNLSTERTRMGRHTVEGIIQSDGALRVLSGAQRDYTYSGNDGEVCTITVHISDEMAEGDYPIIFRNIKLTETDISQTYNTSYLKATLSVSTYTLGDINGDGAIDVADYIGVANAILGMPPTSYVEKAADVNVDGIVDVADYIGVANLILYGNVYGSNGNQVKAFVLTPEDIFIGSVIRK